MVIVIAVLLLIIFIWLIILAKDIISYLIRRFGKNQSPTQNLRPDEQMKDSRWCQNFLLRFVYEFFLEFCICIFLQLSVKDFSEFSPGLQFYLSVGIVIALIALIIFVVSLCFKNGPWISNYYMKGTSASSLMKIRPCDPNFDRKKYLKEHPVPKVKPWGRFIVHFDCNKLARCGRQK